MTERRPLQRFGVSETDRIGAGGESIVYAFGPDRVLRLWRTATLGHVERLAELLTRLDRGAVPFRLPEMLELHDVDGRVVSVERLIPGVPMSTALRALRGPQRADALRSFVRAAAKLPRAGWGFDAWGDLLSPDAVRTSSWNEYLVRKLRLVVGWAAPSLRAHLPDLDPLVDELVERIARIGDVDRPRLVHGDVFPGNVMMDAAHAVTGVLDLSTHTVAGDPRMDLASAIVQLDVGGPTLAGDWETVTQVVLSLAPGSHDVIDLYARWYAVYFAQWGDAALARWGARVLTAPPLLERARAAGIAL
ncbi:MAG TPA: phosphotransferase [Actinomycetota bacterium]|nr:phosphotransferase [Actinomycetota bacterium]